MPAQLGGPTSFDSYYHFALLWCRRVLVAKGPAGGAKNVSHFQAGPPLPRLGSTRLGDHRALFASSALQLPESVEGARDSLKILGAHLCVVSRRRQVGMPKQRLNHPDIGPVFKKVRSKSVPKRVQRYTLLDPYLLDCRPKRSTDHIDVHGAAASAWKQVGTAWSRLHPVVPKLGQQLWTKKDEAILSILGAANVYHHPLAIDVLDLQMQCFGNSQSCGVGRG
jgi:hypothetical protein